MVTNKTLYKSLLISSILLISVELKADNFACEALLCFAGGKNLTECKPTIKKVLKDLAKGKSFPVCNFVSFDGSSISSNNYVSVNTYEQEWGDTKCQDGESNPFRYKKRYYCRTIEVNVSPEYSADKEHQRQLYNYD